MSTLNIAHVVSFLVRNTDGSIDDAASQQAFAGALSQYKAERETELATIATAVHAVFAAYPGTRLNMPSVWTFASRLLNASPENEQILKEKTLDYVRANAPDPNGKVSPAEAKAAGYAFHIGNGKGGGVVFLNDWVEKEPAKK